MFSLIRQKLHRLQEDQRGMTMTEILIAFVILMLCAGILSTCFQMSSEMIMKSRDIDEEYRVYQEKMTTRFTDPDVSDDASPYDTTPSGAVTYRFSNGTFHTTLETANEAIDTDHTVYYFSTKNE